MKKVPLEMISPFASYFLWNKYGPPAHTIVLVPSYPSHDCNNIYDAPLWKMSDVKFSIFSLIYVTYACVMQLMAMIWWYISFKDCRICDLACEMCVYCKVICLVRLIIYLTNLLRKKRQVTTSKSWNKRMTFYSYAKKIMWKSFYL